MVLTIEFTSYHLLIGAIVFFSAIAEWKGDALYWFMSFILSLYILFNRPETSVIPVAIFVGWIFVTLYQLVSLIMNRNEKAHNLGGEDN